MTRWMTMMLVAVVAMTLAPPTGAQVQEGLEEAAETQELFRRVEMYEQLGAGPMEALELAIITSRKLEPTQMMLLLSRMRGGGSLGGLELAALMHQLGGRGGTGITALNGSLFVAENGWVYRIDPDTLEVQDRHRYAPEAGGAMFVPEDERLLAAVDQWAQRSARLSHVKQLCMACLMYAQDWDMQLPGQDWVQATMPYLKNQQVYQSPAQPELPVGYALNEKVSGANYDNITRPAETVMLFESNVGGSNPVGGVDAVPEAATHGEDVAVGFVDGHAKMITPQALRELLGRDE
ncbi:MAG: hypothetical protein U9R79_17150 [Armatimonadota bacterium]|nr:hypothetical protein [Armatimonadota bacterium]